MIKLARIIIIGGAVVGVLPLPLVALVSGVWGRDVTIITVPPNFDVEFERSIWTKGEPVTKIYGIPKDKPDRIVFADPKDIIVPPEDPTLTLLKVDNNSGKHPLHAQTLWFFAKWITIGGFAAHFAGLIFRAILRKRAAPSPTPVS